MLTGMSGARALSLFEGMVASFEAGWCDVRHLSVVNAESRRGF
jgi:hypothetical protein